MPTQGMDPRPQWWQQSDIPVHYPDTLIRQLICTIQAPWPPYQTDDLHYPGPFISQLICTIQAPWPPYQKDDLLYPGPLPERWPALSRSLIRQMICTIQAPWPPYQVSALSRPPGILTSQIICSIQTPLSGRWAALSRSPYQTDGLHYSGPLIRQIICTIQAPWPPYQISALSSPLNQTADLH